MPACTWVFRVTSRKNSFCKRCWAACSLRENRASTRQSCATWLLHPAAHRRRQSIRWRREGCGQFYQKQFGLRFNGRQHWAGKPKSSWSERNKNFSQLRAIKRRFNLKRNFADSKQRYRYREAVTYENPGLLQPWVGKSRSLPTRNGLRRQDTTASRLDDP